MQRYMRLLAFRSLLGATVSVAAVLALCASSRAQSVYDVTLSTTGLSGSSGYLAFDFTDGDGVNDNTVSVSSFSTNGVLVGATSSSGGATGNLPGALSITDSSFFNESLQQFTYGTSLSFRVTLSQTFSGGTPDEFSFFLLDASGNNSAVTTSDLSGLDSVFVVDVTGVPGGSLQAFTTTTPGVSFQIAPVPSSAPEPGTLGLVGMALGGFFLAKRTRTQ